MANGEGVTVWPFSGTQGSRVGKGKAAGCVALVATGWGMHQHEDGLEGRERMPEGGAQTMWDSQPWPRPWASSLLGRK